MSDLFTMLQAAAGATGEEVDPYFNQTTLLLHGDGAYSGGADGQQNNTFLDSSTNNFTITRNGNTTQGTFSPFSAPDGRWSNYFDGSGDVLNFNGGTPLTFGTGDFTIEFWVYYNTGLTADVALYDSRPTSTNGAYPLLYSNPSGKMVYYVSSAARITSTTTLVANNWYHIALARSGTDTKLFINGTQEGSTYSDSTNYLLGTSRPSIGAAGILLGADPLNGYMSNVRVVKGTAVYTSNFTPSTTPLTAITNTSLLTCQSNRFVDNSTNNFAITRNGDVKVTPFSPFAPTAAYSASVNGGSGYFASGNYCTVADNQALDPDSSDFTLEAWVYPVANAPAGYGVAYSKGDFCISIAMQSSTNDFWCGISTNGSSWTNPIDTNVPLRLNEWTHIALVRNTTAQTIVAYINGVNSGQLTSFTAAIANNANPGYIGVVNGGATTYFPGYISGLRFVKGTAVYTSNFTPPTAPPTNITNTSLLLNFTNAGIFDNTGKNNLETVGNAQIDTTTKKYGTGSMEFDGTGDLLKTSPSPNNILGSGDFAIQFWVYPNNTSTAFRPIIASNNYATVVGGWIVYQYGTSIEMYYSAGGGSTPKIVDATSSLTASTWKFVTIVRESGTLKCFVDGVEKTSSANTVNFTGDQILLGGNAANNLFLNGFLDDVRVTVGEARDGSVVPIEAFPDL